MHIVFVEEGYPHPRGGGGAGTYVQLVGKALVERGVMVSVISQFFEGIPQKSDDHGITVYRPNLTKKNLHWYLSKIPVIRIFALSIRYLEHGWGIFQFLNQLHRHDPIDLIEFAEGGDFWHAVFHSIPYISHLHGSRFTFLKMAGSATQFGDWLERRLELLFIRHSKLVLSPSQAMLDVVTAENGRPFKMTRVIPLPIEAKSLISPYNRTKVGPIQVFFAARNDPVKGGDVLLRAIPLVVEKFPDVQFHFFGYQIEDSPIFSQLFIHPFLPKSELLTWLSKSDICVVPSYWDNSPNTVYEAMAAGKPVVASSVGGIPELVTEETGILVNAGNEHELAGAILTLCLDETKRIRMGNQGRRRIQQIANLETNVKTRLAEYQANASKRTR